MQAPTKVAVFGKAVEVIKPLIAKHGFTVVSEHPELVFSYGGDGALMQAEHAYPGIPKMPLRHSRVCKVCPPFDNETVLKKIKAGKYRLVKHHKLQVNASGEQLIALNDIVVHNYDPRHAIRYHLVINGAQIGEEIIGDGFVVATPFGATGYYRSITDSIFEVGLGVAFNNSTEPSDHLVVAENSLITTTIRRGPAIIYADNQAKLITVSAGEQATIRKSDLSAQMVKLD
ncbi:MAG: NAD(+)/NADH kinase [Candidatus Vogelbacteria bacterium]|nr:NAD(+)/NADH kinase [Candidatus Vogelbacteria bacterium]